MVLFLFGVPEARPPEGQWDFDTYYHAARVYEAGGNPYERRELVEAAGWEVLPFTYPHHTLAFFHLFARGDLSVGKWAFLIGKLVCVAGLCLLWMRWFVDAGARGWFLAFAALGYGAAIWRDVVAGNVSLFEQVFIWLGVLALMRGRAGLFCAAIILAAQFKGLPILLLGLVLLTDEAHKWRVFATAVIACVLIAAGVYLSDAEAARSFLRAASRVGAGEAGGEVNPCMLFLTREGVAAVLGRFSGPGGVGATLPGYVAYAMVVIVMLVGLLRLAATQRGARVPRDVLFLGLLTYALIAPRMKDYSYILVLVPTFEMIRRMIGRPEIGKWGLLLLVGLLALPGVDMLWRYRCLLLVGMAWVAGLRLAGVGPAIGQRLGGKRPRGSP